mmetsp:Transcript_3903/g.6115  ORF Transcript_3903/g.6115 Transcript_3903/m.6115 type:complete len:590 (-) Transcript_3903:137-1906(-)|eukprot:CAMPEP_0185031356 /NCGR_PEP_ID=MMETSP1103-20130426/18769_1 /TAXON_ID=36769 /ORGANISM="Paraphysomonas bandaiensis, Strain Caron Lab Isolate" /LENGTH=589 /DNA_ID=CAMNT_0027566857 /DNA_START=77 /DNA_END=1846 /DNA_ORIENTATION=-
METHPTNEHNSNKEETTDITDNQPGTPGRQTIFGSIIDYVRKDSTSKESKEELSRRNSSHLLTWSNGIRQMVSKKKRRHKEDGFDLDLTYITPRIIAMGFPARGNEGIYRNNAVHVTEFLKSKHGDKVKIYNLCSERDYPVEMFGGRVSKYPFDDHNPPPMPMFLPYCKDVDDWLNSDEDNVVAIHCKAGKGRTGVMICAYLLYINEWDNAEDCMRFYGFARTNNQKGVTIPSQRRFIGYFAELCRTGTAPSETECVKDDYPRGRTNSITGVDKRELIESMDDAKKDLESGDENESDSDEDGRKLTTMESLDECVLGQEMQGLSVEVAEDTTERPVIQTSTGEFKDYSGSCDLKAKLRRASLQAAATTKGKRVSYAQASLWMTSHQEEVQHMLQDCGEEMTLGDDTLGTDKFLLERKCQDNDSHTADPVCQPTSLLSTREKGEVYSPVALSVIEIRLSANPRLNMMGSFDPVFRIKCGGSTITSTDFLPSCTYRGQGPITLPVPAVTVVDEFLITIYDKTAVGKKKICQFWLHSGFIRDNKVVLTKPEIDKVHKDKKHKKFPKDFTIEVLFEEVTFELEEVSDVVTGAI